MNVSYAGLLYLLIIFCTPFGLVVGVVGLILRLCEWGWREPPGSLGSRGLLPGAAVLCFPILVLVVLYVISSLPGR